MNEIALSSEARLTAGILLLSIVAVESGGAVSLTIGVVALGIGVLTGS